MPRLVRLRSFPSIVKPVVRSTSVATQSGAPSPRDIREGPLMTHRPFPPTHVADLGYVSW